jgi:hypothetical protein
MPDFYPVERSITRSARPGGRSTLAEADMSRCPRSTAAAEHTEENTVADEPVTAPDQHKPGFEKAARIGAIVSIVILLLMLLGNHRGNIENIWLIATAAIMAFALVADHLMRKYGLKR